MIGNARMANPSLRLVNLLQVKKPIFILTKAFEPVPPATKRAHEVQAETIKVRRSRLGIKFYAATDALPHAQSVVQTLSVCGNGEPT